MGRILLDVDGVMAEFTNHLCKKIGLECEEPDPTTFTQWDFIKHHLNTLQAKVCDQILSKPEFWLTQPLMPGAKDAVDLFLQKGHEVHFVTHRWPGCLGWTEARIEWVEKNLGIKYSFVHIAGHKYVYDGEVFVDDRETHIEAWKKERERKAQHEAEAMLFHASYNRNFPWVPRLNGWHDGAGLNHILHIAGGGKRQTSPSRDLYGYGDQA